jgi:hypothetical protein
MVSTVDREVVAVHVAGEVGAEIDDGRRDLGRLTRATRRDAGVLDQPLAARLVGAQSFVVL